MSDKRRGRRGSNSRAGHNSEPAHHESITASLKEAGKYYQCFSALDKSASNGFLLKRGKPFTTIPVLIYETHRNKKRYVENETTPRRSTPNLSKQGVIKQIMKDGEPIV